MSDVTFRLKDQKRIWGNVKVVEGDECWEWRGACSPNGYGKTEIWQGGVRTAKTSHRIIYEMHLGRHIPKDVFVCHKCDNKKCCRPDHLFLGTAHDNMIDCINKGRHFEASKTHCKNGHEFTPTNTLINKKGHRYCNACWGKEARRTKYFKKSIGGQNGKQLRHARH